MKKLFLSALITLGIACPQSAFAGGGLVTGGKSLSDQGRTEELNNWLQNICGATEQGWGYWKRWSITGTPDNNVGDVYFVGLNNYWKGSTSGGSYSPYTQINEGVDKIEKIADTAKQTTSSGTFYVYEAKNVNKYFFIVRRSSKKENHDSQAFAWYDEWSYVENAGNKGWDDLEASYDKLKNGEPFFAPHNCDTSLETNHYITLNGKDDYSEKALNGYSFTTFLYIPNNAQDETKPYPYTFFYTAKLAGQLSDKKAIEYELDCPYDAVLSWNTVFDLYNSQVSDTKYDGMKEHYILERSFDKINWTSVGDITDVVGDDVKTANGKGFTDTTLPDFDETTAKIGYTVYYRLTSQVQKTDGTLMASRMAEEIVTLNIPGTSPFALTLKDGSKSTYKPGSLDEYGAYVDGTNVFNNTVVASETAKHDEVTLAAGAKLQLVRTSGTESTVCAEYEITDASMSLSDLVAKIGTNGTFTEAFTVAAGDKKDAEYQLVLTLGESTIESNIVAIVGDKVENTAVIAHRSGTPDAATCAEQEAYVSQVKFKPALTGVNTGYKIYCDGEEVMSLSDANGKGQFTDGDGKTHNIDGDGNLSLIFVKTGNPIAEGEAGSVDEPKIYNYAVVHYNNNTGNTYGSAAKQSQFAGETGELVVNFNTVVPGDNHIGYDYNNAYVRPVLKWTVPNNIDEDVLKPIRYEIYRKVELAPFEKTNVEANVETLAADNKKVDDTTLGEFVKVGTVEQQEDGTVATTHNDEFYYKRKPQTTGNKQGEQLSEDEYRPTTYYVKAVYSDDETVAQYLREKNSAPIVINYAEGTIFTGVDAIWSDEVTVEAANGQITVTGAEGTVEVYSAAGQKVAAAQADGTTTTIDASAFNGVYVVKANNMKPTKILIK